MCEQRFDIVNIQFSAVNKRHVVGSELLKINSRYYTNIFESVIFLKTVKCVHNKNVLHVLEKNATRQYYCCINIANLNLNSSSTRCVFEEEIDINYIIQLLLTLYRKDSIFEVFWHSLNYFKCLYIFVFPLLNLISIYVDTSFFSANFSIRLG